MEILTGNDGIVNQKLCSGFGQLHTARKNAKYPKPYTTITLVDIAGMLETPQRTAKEKAQWIIPSTLLSRVHSEQREKGRFCALWFDADKVEGLTFEDIFSRTLGVIDSDFLLYTTRSATKDNPKSRIIILLLHSVSGTEFIILQTILNNKLEAAGITPDRKTEHTGQICYLPNEGEFYTYFHRNDAGPFDPGTWVDEIAEIKANLEAEKQALHAKQEESRIKAASRMAHGATSPMDAYKAEFSLSLVLTSYGYVQRGDRWLSPNSSSGVPGVIIKGDRWISSHSSDAGIGMPNKNGNGTNGDAWDLFVHYSHGGNHDAALKDAGEMFTTSDGVSINKANQREFMQNKAERETLAGFDGMAPEEEKHFSLAKFTLTGEAKMMEKKMLNDIHIMRGLALLGQSTVFYAASNVGKTLITIYELIQAIKAGIIKGEDVFYINADDTYRGLVEKLRIAEKYGFHMLAPGHKNFRADMLAPALKSMIEDDSSKGKIIILDTVKKFVDLMDKKAGSDFTEKVRQFSSHGGSLISLGHVNKHRSGDGKVVHAGTTDMTDDSDCTYSADVISYDKISGLRTVKFENTKCRGDVEQEITYQYDASKSLSYQQRLDSIKRMDDAEVEQVIKQTNIEKTFLKNKDAIDIIRKALMEADEPISKKDLIKIVMDESGISRNRILRTLTEHEGLDQTIFQFWETIKGPKNTKLISLNPAFKGGGSHKPGLLVFLDY